MNVHDYMPGVPAAGHIAGGYWHPGPARNCSKGQCGAERERERKERAARNRHDFVENTNPRRAERCDVCGYDRHHPYHDGQGARSQP